jgi:hypothetical protein
LYMSFTCAGESSTIKTFLSTAVIATYLSRKPRCTFRASSEPCRRELGILLRLVI